jgi:hypothetical protein
MNYLFAQIMLAARDRGRGGWMQIVIFVVLAIIYALGSIVKARANKADAGDEEKLRRAPPRRPPGGKARPPGHPAVTSRPAQAAMREPRRKTVRQTNPAGYFVGLRKHRRTEEGHSVL